MEYGFQQYNIAIKHFKELNKRQPYNSHNIYSLSQIYTQNQQYNKALKELEKYQFLEGHSVQILAQRTAIHEQAGKTHKAEKEITNYINKHPEDKLDASLLLSHLYIKNNKNTESLNILTQLNNEYPNDGTILTSLADQYKKLNNDSLYEKYSLDAVKSATFNAETAVKIIRPILSGYVQNEDTQNIQSILNTLNQTYPNEAPIIELQADLYKALKDTINWRTSLYQLQKIRNNDKVLDFQLVTLAESLSDNKEIYRLTKEGYNKYADDTWAFYYILSLAKNEMTDTLISESNRLLPTITTSNIKSRIYQMIGDIYSSQNQNTLAMEMYDSCLVYDPNNSGALNNVAYNITKQPNPDLKRAEKMAAKALEIEHESIYVLDPYAWILFLLGDNFLSEFYFDKLLRIEKEQNLKPSIETLYHLGCLYLKTNRIEQTKELWLKALNLYNENPDNFDEKEIINTIQNFFNDNK
jgi:predicted Zn-dependent protease